MANAGEVLPAYAGMIPVPVESKVPFNGAPRIRGDDPGSAQDIRIPAACSPHTRG